MSLSLCVLAASCGGRTEHPEVGLALGGAGGQPVDLAEELPLVRQLHLLEAEPVAPLARDHLDAPAVVRVVVHHLLAAVGVGDTDPRAAAHVPLPGHTARLSSNSSHLITSQTSCPVLLDPPRPANLHCGCY